MLKVKAEKVKTNLFYLFLASVLCLLLAVTTTITIKGYNETYCEKTTAETHIVLSRHDTEGIKIYFPVYTYKIGDKEYQITGSHSSDKDKYKVGDKTTLYYNPKNPSDSIVKTKIPYIIKYSLYGLSSLLFIVFIIFFVKYHKSKKNS